MPPTHYAIKRHICKLVSSTISFQANFHDRRAAQSIQSAQAAKMARSRAGRKFCRLKNHDFPVVPRRHHQNFTISRRERAGVRVPSERIHTRTPLRAQPRVRPRRHPDHCRSRLRPAIPNARTPQGSYGERPKQQSAPPGTVVNSARQLGAHARVRPQKVGAPDQQSASARRRLIAWGASAPGLAPHPKNNPPRRGRWSRAREPSAHHLARSESPRPSPRPNPKRLQAHRLPERIEERIRLLCARHRDRIVDDEERHAVNPMPPR
jgi:hypothetical protein